jgi:hypothetical protein
MNNQFTSVFTSEDPLQPLPDLGPSPHPAVSDITITQEGVQKRSVVVLAYGSHPL